MHALPGAVGHDEDALTITALLTARRAAWLLGGYACLLLVVVFEPFPRLAVGSVQVGDRLLAHLGLQGAATPDVVEFALNVALFVPLTFLGSHLARRVTWGQWFGAGLLASGTVELVQLVALPDRSASLWDLTANSLGALLGALAARAPLRRGEQPEATMGCTESPDDGRPDDG